MSFFRSQLAPKKNPQKKVAWLGGKGNRAQWVASGGLLVALGSALFTLPQWISDPYTPSGTDINNLGKLFYFRLVCYVKIGRSVKVIAGEKERESLC